MRITTVEGLRALYPQPGERAVRKQLPSLDTHCRRFIALSPFLVLSTAGSDGRLDASPRGGAPGFVRIAPDGDLLIPDSPGNNRLDSLQNILANSEVGLLFLIPGFDETLRVNGQACLSQTEADLTLCRDERRLPRLAIRVTVHEAYLHCAKAFMRSRLWDPTALTERGLMPTIGEMIRDQTGGDWAVETEAQMRARYQADL
jgi:PPOX class probable FMN-dependent enzyme